MAKKNEEHEYDAAHTPAADDSAATATASAPAAKPAKRYNFNNLNTLSVVSIATALTGFGAVAGVITEGIAAGLTVFVFVNATTEVEGVIFLDMTCTITAE